MKLKDASISILCGEERTTIELHDEDSNITFAKAYLTASQLAQALSRLSHTRCTMEVMGLDNVGKVMEHQSIEFEIPNGSTYGKERDALAKKAADTHVSKFFKGWVSDNYFGSQGSFFSKDGKKYARCNIRRWISEERVSKAGANSSPNKPKAGSQGKGK